MPRGSLATIAAVSLTLTLFSPLLGSIRFIFPLLVCALYQLPLDRLLWTAFGAGCLLDTLSADGHFGLFALSACASVSLLYPLRQRFYRDGLSTLPLLTALLSAGTSLLLLFLRSLPVTAGWVMTDLLALPVADALFALGLACALKLLRRTNPPDRPFSAERPR